MRHDACSLHQPGTGFAVRFLRGLKMKLFKLLAIAPLVLLSTNAMAQSRDHRGDDRRSDSRRSYDSRDRGRYDNDRSYRGSRYSYSYSRPYSNYRPARSYSRGYVAVVDPYYYDDYYYAPSYAYGAYDYYRPTYRPYVYYPAPRYRSGISIGLTFGGSRHGRRR